MDSYWEQAWPTYIENWPSKLRELSVPSVDIPLAWTQLRSLALHNGAWGQLTGLLPDSYWEPDSVTHAEQQQLWERLAQPCTLLAAQVDAVLAEQGWDRSFVRLGSRSPKDSYTGYRAGWQCTSGAQAVAWLTDESERMFEDYMLYISALYQPHLWVREWCSREPMYEFRCFQRNRQLEGISQYHYQRHYAGLTPTLQSQLGMSIRLWWEHEFAPHVHLDDVVFDVWAAPDPADVVLIEINPYGRSTDPCLHNWDELPPHAGPVHHRLRPRVVPSAEQPDEGWGWPGLARKCHYFKGGTISLCGKWMYGGRLVPDEGTSKDDCVACRRALDKAKA